ncbi:MAG: hypothetical protein JNK52_01215 [Zoogloeaceae bacterium]|nr:hypothetical protein [Zoogloeaceae bacterium]
MLATMLAVVDAAHHARMSRQGEIAIAVGGRFKLDVLPPFSEWLYDFRAAALRGFPTRSEECQSMIGAARSRIGIITGSGPETGVDLWTKVLRANRELLGSDCRGDLEAPEVVIFSVPELDLSMELERNDAAVWQTWLNSAGSSMQ